MPAKSNAELVEKIVRIARDLGKKTASPDETREILHLPPLPDRVVQGVTFLHLVYLTGQCPQIHGSNRRIVRSPDIGGDIGIAR